jgi:hypothetical protein
MKSKPLIVTIDWGNIMTMTVSQDQGERYRNLKTFHLSSPKIIDDLIDEKFAPYYEDKKKHNNVSFTMTVMVIIRHQMLE